MRIVTVWFTQISVDVWAAIASSDGLALIVTATAEDNALSHSAAPTTSLTWYEPVLDTASVITSVWLVAPPIGEPSLYHWLFVADELVSVIVPVP